MPADNKRFGEIGE